MKCQISKTCGSCQYIEDDYQHQLINKQEYCQKLFKNFQLNVHPVIGMDDPYGYRNKVIVAFNSQYEYGLYEESSHRIVPMKECLLHDEKTNSILKCIQILFKKYRVSIYDEKRNKGLVKYILVRRAIQTDQSLVTLVVNDNMFAGSKNFCNELIKKCPDVKTVVLNINKRQTSVVLSKEEKILYGKGFIVDELCGMTFKISSQSFYQINHQQCTKLYQKVLDLLSLNKDSIVLDTYCGIGTIGMVVAPHVKKVIGVELNTQAYKDAINNAKMNHLDNIQFVNEDATVFMKNLASHNEKVNCVIMDPPRAGSTKEFVQSIQVLKPDMVVYVSCDPTTQVRDLEYFKDIGYVCQDVHLYDMFPHTAHVETIVLLQRR
ncbi:MAG: 23S rRNA (uracil(1939)-C(5))-methyltransferase RlmD [Coprobacillus sp.]